MKPDWSKAPEGATLYHPAVPGRIEHWLKPVNGVWFVFTAVGQTWVPHVDPVMDDEYYARTVPEWTGEGLPPVGTVCALEGQKAPITILTHVNQPDFDGDGKMQWLAVGQQPNHGMIHMATADYWKPYRTPEQIAAEEREKAIKQLAHELPALPNMHVGEEMALRWAACLHDAGYRKVEGGAE